MIIWIAISSLLLAGYAALMLFYFSGWIRAIYFSLPAHFSPQTKVSVVIAARNEEENIENCIRSLLLQDYPADLFEIIVVDDHSEDGTMPIVRAFEKASLRVPISDPAAMASERSNPLNHPDNSTGGIAPPRLHAQSHSVGSRNNALISGYPSPRPGKKNAIAFGIEHAGGDLIITTDADCVAGEKWISTIAAYYEKFQPKMIAAPVAFSGENSWLEKWQSLDLCGMMAITAGAIANGFPNMCNGANLAYPKKCFDEVGGFEDIDKQPSGDDVMLMQKIAAQYKGGVHFLKSKEAIVYTQPEKTLSGLFQQRLRWLSKGTAFPDWRVSAVLVASWLFNLAIIINFILGFFWRELWLVAGVSFLIKTAAELPLLWSGCSFFIKNKLLLYILPAQTVHILYVTAAGALSKTGRFVWKNRKY